METSWNESRLRSFLDMARHTNHMVLNETHMHWLPYILQNDSLAAPKEACYIPNERI